MIARLTVLGYADLRKDVPLMAFPDLDDMAALVAFDGHEPVVLCYPVDRGRSGDPILQEAAKFQASAIGPDQSAQFVWVSDGESDYFYDLGRDTAISKLPVCTDWRGEAREIISTTRRTRMVEEGRRFDYYADLQQKLNQLHEEIYKKRAGVSTTNEVIDEVGKIVFLKVHSERHPDYVYERRRLIDAFRSDYIRANGMEAVQ